MPELAETRQGVLRRVRAVGLLTFLSRILGLVRDAVMATQFGNGVIMDAFSIAFRIPNTVRQLFGEGALSTAFLPVFIRDLEQEGRDAAFRTATAVLVAVSALLTAIVLVAELIVIGFWLFMPVSREARLLLELLGTLAPYLLLVCVLAQASAIMHGLGHFTMPALFPVLLNVLWIAVTWILWFAIESPELRISLISVSIVMDGVIQLWLCVPTLRRLGFPFNAVWRSHLDRVREIALTMLPVVAGLSIMQLNTLSDSLIAWALTAPADGSQGWLTQYPLNEGTAAALYLGQRMLQFPIGVFGAALGTVIFPVLTRHAERRQMELFRDDLTRGLRLVAAIGIPSSVGMLLIAHPLTVALFQHGNFDVADTAQTTGIVGAYSLGIWSACGLLIVQRAFYALGDRRTPLRIGLWTVGLNVMASLTLVFWIGGRGLALATSLASMAQCVVTVLSLQKQTQGIDWANLMDGLLRTLIATAAMVVACGGATWAISVAELPPGLIQELAALSAPLSAGALTYLVVARRIGLQEPFDLLHRAK